MTLKTTCRKVNRKATVQSAATKKTTALRTASLKKPPLRPAASAQIVRKPKRGSAKPIAPVSSSTPNQPTGATKKAQLIAMLSSQPGATIGQMMTLTGWQAHTVRGTISGVLRKRLGLNVNCAADESGLRVYRIVAAQSA